MILGSIEVVTVGESTWLPLDKTQEEINYAESDLQSDRVVTRGIPKDF